MELYDILVVILSVTLIIFLVVGIVVGVILVQILKRIKTASETAQSAFLNVEEFTSHVKQFGKFTAFGSVASQLMKLFKNRK
jgi:uncharacterized membrane protein